MPNIILFGKSGVGKSTLINAVIGSPVADKNVGSPVTSEVNLYETEIQGNQWTFIDTVGISNENFEIFYDVIIDKYIIKKNNSKLTCDMAWVCISECSSRIEDVEIDLINQIVHYIPVIVVLTKAYFKNGLEAEIKKQFPKVQYVIRVNSEIQNIDGITINKSNIENLVEITESIINNNKMGNNNVASTEKLTSNDPMKIIEKNTISVAYLVMPTESYYKEIVDKMLVGMCTCITNELNLNKQFHNEIIDIITHLNNEYLKNEKKYFDNVKKLIPFCSNEINIEYATYFYSIGKMYLKSFKSKHENNTLNDDRPFSSMNDTHSLMNTISTTNSINNNNNDNNNKNNNKNNNISSMNYQNSNQSINNNRYTNTINKDEYSNLNININNNLPITTLFDYKRNISSTSLTNSITFTNGNNNDNNENNRNNKNKNINSKDYQKYQSNTLMYHSIYNVQRIQKNDNGNSRSNYTDYGNKNLKKRSNKKEKETFINKLKKLI